MAAPAASLIWVGVGALILWRLYSRIRRMVGRQRSKLTRHWIQSILFPVLLVLIGLGTIGHPVSAATLLAGIAAGIGLGMYGLKLTRFEVTPQGHFYTPHAHLGIALSLLFIARIGWRFWEVSQMTDAVRATHMQDFGRSPLTLVVFGLLASYYTTYAIGLIRWRKREEPNP